MNRSNYRDDVNRNCKVSTTRSKVINKKYQYGNLTCPFEWSKYSCEYQGNSYSDVYSSHLKFINVNKDKQCAVSNRFDVDTFLETLGTRNLYFFGDSVMREQFISLACMLWSNQAYKSVFTPWKEKWKCRSINCIESGAHGGFDYGCIILKNDQKICLL
eukprot:UN28312